MVFFQVSQETSMSSPMRQTPALIWAMSHCAELFHKISPQLIDLLPCRIHRSTGR